MFRRRKQEEPTNDDSTDLGLLSGVSGGLQKALDAALLEDDELLVCMEGAKGEGIAVTRSRVIILKAGVPSGAARGHKASTYFIKDIVAVEISSGVTMGRLEVAVPGTKKTDSGGGLGEARKAENLVQFYPSNHLDKMVSAQKIIIRLAIESSIYVKSSQPPKT